MSKTLFWAALGASLVCSEVSKAAEFIVPNTTVSSFEFSGMVLNSSVPSLNCVVTGPKDMAATISVMVLLFETPASSYPYAKVSGNAVISPSRPRGACNINNGHQTIPPLTPAKIEIQISTNDATLSANVPVILPPPSKQ